MTVNWKHYRYMRNSAAVRAGIRAMEKQVTQLGMYHIPKSKVASIESKIQSGDVIGITTYDGKRIGTSHVGLAYRDSNGVLRQQWRGVKVPGHAEAVLQAAQALHLSQ